MTSNDGIRLQVLELLHEHEQENPGECGPNRGTILNLLQEKLGADVTEKRMDFNILYLEEKKLVKLLKVLGSLWHNSNITSFGTDVIEHKDRYADRFPFISVHIQNISDSTIVGNVIQAQDQAKVVIQKMNDAFSQARELTKTSSDLSEQSKREILSRLDMLEEHIQQSDAGSVQKGWNWFKKNASWLFPIPQPVIIEFGKLIFS